MGSCARTASCGGRVKVTVNADVSLRPAKADDIRAIVAIERLSFGDPWSESAFGELLRSRSAIFLVATRGDEKAIAGYVIGFVIADEAEILNLAVTPGERGRGLGGDLLDAGLDIARKRGAREAFLEVRESNASALALYLSRGFSALSRRGKYYRNPVEDALVLRRVMEG